MWIMLNSAFLSVVADRDNKDQLLVRARVKGHIEAVFPSAKVFTSDTSDYYFRALISRIEVSEAISEQLAKIDYDNFKSSVKNKMLHDAYMNVWTIMYRLQIVKRPPRDFRRRV